MSKRAWLTPNAASGWSCRTLYFPDGEDWDAIVRGALLLLADPVNFEQRGDLSPDETAALFQETLYHHLDQHSCHYAARVMSTAPSNLLAYWRLNESLGAVAHDFAGNDHNGTVTGATWGADGIQDGQTAASFDGINDLISVDPSALSGVFNGAAGTLLMWGYRTTWGASGIWAGRFVGADYGHQVKIYDNNVNGPTFQYRTNGVQKIVKSGAVPPANSWQCLAMTWDAAADQFKGYVNGAQVGTTQTGLGVWAGPLTIATLGYADGYWAGRLAHVALWDTPLSATQIAGLGSVIG